MLIKPTFTFMDAVVMSMLLSELWYFGCRRYLKFRQSLFRQSLIRQPLIRQSLRIVSQKSTVMDDIDAEINRIASEKA